MNIQTNLPKMYRGVIEDNKDPLKIGRVKVRIYGLHTDVNENSPKDKKVVKSGKPFQYISTKDLPWSQVIGGTGFGLISGVGLSSVLRQGTWVWVVLENDDMNTPLVIGTIQGITSYNSINKYKKGFGFFDPDEVYPFESRSKESDYNRLARNDKLSDKAYDYKIKHWYSADDTSKESEFDQTIHYKINQNLNEVTEVDDNPGWASGAEPKQKEPKSTSDKTKYPDSAIIETQSGHIIEIDDTEGNERIRLYHRTGSYIEIKPDGSFVQKSVGTEGNHYIHKSDVNEMITASINRYITGNINEIIKGYVKTNIQATLDEHIVGAVKKQLDSTLDEHIVGAVKRQLDSTLDETIDGAVKRQLNSTLDETVTGNTTINSNANVDWTIGGNLNITVAGAVLLKSSTSVDVKAPIINLN